MRQIIFFSIIIFFFAGCKKEKITPIASTESGSNNASGAVATPYNLPCNFLQSEEVFLIHRFKAPGHFFDNRGSSFLEEGHHSTEILISFDSLGQGKIVILLSCEVFQEINFTYSCTGNQVTIDNIGELNVPGGNISFDIFVTNYSLTDSEILTNNSSYQSHKLTSPNGVEIHFVSGIDWACGDLSWIEICGHDVLPVNQLGNESFSVAEMDAIWYSNYNTFNEVTAVEALYKYVREHLIHVPTSSPNYIGSGDLNLAIEATAASSGGGVCGYYSNFFAQILWERYSMPAINTSLASISTSTTTGGHMVVTVLCTENGVEKWVRLDPMIGETYKWSHDGSYIDCLNDLPRLVVNNHWDSINVVQDQSLTLSWDEYACAQEGRTSYVVGQLDGVYETSSNGFIVRAPRTMPNYLNNPNGGFLGEYQALVGEWKNVFPGMPTLENQYQFGIVNSLCVMGMWGNGINVDSVYTNYNIKRSELIQ